LDRSERERAPADVEALRAIGAAKQANRLDGLSSIGLVRQAGGRVELTGTGRLVAAVFALLAWLTNVQDGV
jgi:superfamily II helicase